MVNDVPHCLCAAVRPLFSTAWTDLHKAGYWHYNSQNIIRTSSQTTSPPMRVGEIGETFLEIRENPLAPLRFHRPFDAILLVDGGYYTYRIN